MSRRHQWMMMSVDRRIAVAAAVGGGIVALLSIVLFAAALGAGGGLAPDLSSLPAERAALVRYGALTDMIGYYLAPVPVMLYLWRRLGGEDDFVMLLGTVAGVMYSVIGSMGAVMVATVVPPLLGEGTEVAATNLELVRQTVFVGLWQTLETIPWAIWLLVVGTRMRRGWLKVMALVIGVGVSVAGVGRFTGVEALVSPLVVIALFPIWLLGLGWRIWQSEPI